MATGEESVFCSRSVRVVSEVVGIRVAVSLEKEDWMRMERKSMRRGDMEI